MLVGLLRVVNATCELSCLMATTATGAPDGGVIVTMPLPFVSTMPILVRAASGTGGVTNARRKPKATLEPSLLIAGGLIKPPEFWQQTSTRSRFFVPSELIAKSFILPKGFGYDEYVTV